jgi:hypothetical protein
MKKILKSIKEPIWMKSKPKSEVAKTGLCDFGNQIVQFSQNR